MHAAGCSRPAPERFVGRLGDTLEGCPEWRHLVVLEDAASAERRVTGYRELPPIPGPPQAPRRGRRNRRGRGW